MKILGIIPARGGSKSVPRKNIKELAGKPLIQYTVEAGKHAKLISRLILSSDDAEIIEVAKTLNLEVPFIRPSHLAEDSSPTLPVIQHALKYFEALNINFDAVCLLQVTSPFKTSDFIDEAINKFSESGADSLVSVQKVPAEYNPHWTFKPDENNFLKLTTSDKEIISRRQDLPTVYHRDGLIYITKTSVLLNQNSLYGKKIAYIESPPEGCINIDTMSDWKQAENYLKQNTQ
jgi:N-acylneuraminate cytidylyltransferase